MKTKNNKLFISLLLAGFFLFGCSKILEEKPRSIFTPDFFKSEQGVVGGVNFLYLNLRYTYGNAYYYNTGETGTDEVTYAQSADDNFKVMDLSGQGNITSSNSRSDVLWNRAYSAINTASGVIENGTDAGISPGLLAEAKFFRAFYYFQLVQTFGGVPLDLGAGILRFNDAPVRVSTRNTVPEVYTLGIFPDLLAAINDLPDVGRVTGGVTKKAAELYLAQSYLTYGWWLENPNNIPTYPATNRTDPDGHDAAWYYQQAYDVAVKAIRSPGSFGLQPTFYDVNNGANDRNNEILLYVDHTEASEQYNGASLTYSNGGDQDNFAGWMMTWNYPLINSSTSNTKWTALVSVDRVADQRYGRPWIRMSPTIGAFKNTFADKTNDSRFDGTFTTVYRANWDASKRASGTQYNANFMPIQAGDAVLTFLGEEPSTAITYPSNQGDPNDATGKLTGANVGAGTLPGRSDFVIGPDGISRIVYPGLWKLGPYRTDNDGGLGQPNAASTRPFNIAKFSELFFVAAEAAVKGANTSSVSGPYSNDGTARGLINVIRSRAGKWKWSVNGNVAKTDNNSPAMVVATPATITIDYILAERSREYYGEGKRWLDLVRTQEWTNKASSYQIGGTAYGNHTPQTVTRDIQQYHYLRPIPQSQLDAMQMEEAEKKAYQNPGYN